MRKDAAVRPPTDESIAARGLFGKKTPKLVRVAVSDGRPNIHIVLQHISRNCQYQAISWN
jgi:hypothetical protein